MGQGRKIAVEVKRFAGGSTISEFHTALGQLLNYQAALEVSNEPERILYLATPTDTYQTFLRFEPAKTVIEKYKVRLINYNPVQEVIKQWIEQSNTAKLYVIFYKNLLLTMCKRS